MKLGKLLGLIGFVVGFIGPFFFYSVPSTFRSYLACPVCAYSARDFQAPIVLASHRPERTNPRTYLCSARSRDWVFDF
jgi:hypothetical protein